MITTITQEEEEKKKKKKSKRVFPKNEKEKIFCFQVVGIEEGENEEGLCVGVGLGVWS